MEQAPAEEQLEFSLDPHALDKGSAEEKASFGILSITANGQVMTEGVALDSSELHPGPRVSGYHLALWIVRNWWRIAFEPALANPVAESMDWDLAHWMSTIGEGYVWPNILLASDGFRLTVTSSASEDPYAKAFRYVGSGKPQVVAVERLRDATRSLVDRIMDMLGRAHVAKTELHALWQTLQEETGSPEAAVRRRIEAMLGYDPNGTDPAYIDARIADTDSLGIDAVAELAADANARASSAPSTAAIRDAARNAGFDGNVRDAVKAPSDAAIPAWGTCAAWRIGVSTAHALRRTEKLDGKPVGNELLASMAGTSQQVIDQAHQACGEFSFAFDTFDNDSGSSRIVMRSKWKTGRRFDLARLIADRLFASNVSNPLLPATQSHTYRQKAQRAFAIELLAPIVAIEDFLRGDRSEDRLNEAADHFDVSPVAIHSHLAHNHRL